jgi:prepilin-type N-terminal cleavage/methylation domain-containing protein
LRRIRRGVTVVEILVAMVLLAVGVVFALTAVSYATKATAGTTQSTEATAYARKILEIVMTTGPKGAIFQGAINPRFVAPTFRPLCSADTGEVAPPFELSDFVLPGSAEDERLFRSSAAGFELRVEVTPYSDPGPPAAIMDGLYAVDVQLRWRDRLGLRTASYPGLYRAE